MTIAGGCRCGAVRYTLAADRLPAAYACHCHQCQRWSGSAFSQQAIVAEDTLRVTGPIIEYRREAGDRTSLHRICSVCHTRIYNSNTLRPGLVIMRAGTFDDSAAIECRAHIFTATRQRWFVLPDGVPAWPDTPEPATFVALMTGDAPAG